ncbi:MAG: class I SAM-dependent rRNA methyltransferase [Anaerolineae bacterium]
MSPLRLIPPAPTKRIAIRVIPAAERALREGHPWLFAQSIRRQSHDGRAGDLAVIFDRKDRFLAVGLYDPESPIRVRILQHQHPAAINQSWFQARLAAAASLRASLPATQTTGYRLVHGENDGLPGLVIDRYHQTYVTKLYTAAWAPHLQDVVAALTAVAAPERILLRLSRAVAEQRVNLHGLREGTMLYGPPVEGPVRFAENSLYFGADVLRGQKTGFFLDQRENRARVERLAQDQSVLNLFAYTGGFSLYAARGGAASVTSVDISRPALDAAVRNFALNPALSHVPHKLIQGDVFEVLTSLQGNRVWFDLVIIDPPSFAKQQAEVERASAAYARLVRAGLGVLRPGGTLVMASCSSQVSATSFFALVLETAMKMGRPLQEIERTAHPVDHPIGFKEGAYLKCLFAVAP